jgi:CRP/FNR family transcriptional regulator, cyclic AMP receptor protein
MSPVTAADAGTYRGASFYRTLAPADRGTLALSARAQGYRRGYLLTVEGEPADHVTVLLRGWAKSTTVTTGGMETLLRLYEPGDLIGGEAILGGQARPESVTALTPCRCLVIPASRFAELLARNPGIDHGFREAMVRRVMEGDQQIRNRLYRPLPRLARVLADLAYRSGIKADEGIRIPVDLSQEDLASWIGASRATVARMLTQLRQDGIVLTGYRHTVITDLEKLDQVARADELDGPGADR